jgi:hypothetical protein
MTPSFVASELEQVAAVIDNTLPGGLVERTITYEAPFDRCDRVEDYRVVWGYFEGGGNKP